MKVCPTAILFFFILLITSMTGCFIFTPITTILALLERQLRGRKMFQESSVVIPFLNKWNNIVEGSWFHMVDILLEVFYDIRVQYTLVDAPILNIKKFITPPAPGKFNILILNHRTRIDWMLAWMLLARTDMMFGLKIVLKDSLGRAPLFGWAMQTFRFLFLSRKWQEDEKRFASVFEYAKRTNDSATYLIFPEGSDLSPSNVEKSNKFAKENNLPVYRHVLNPRTTGIVAIKNMLGVDRIDQIYDITMGYTDYVKDQRPGEEHLLNGEMPHAVHFLVSRHKFADGDVPKEDDLFRKWIEDRFAKKEILLSKFYQASPVGFTKPMVTEAFGSSKVTVDTVSASIGSRGWKQRAYETCEAVTPIPFFVAVIMWLMPSVYFWVFKIFLFPSWLLMVYVVAASGAYVYVTKKFGGVDRMLLY